MTDDALLALAREALEYWGGRDPQLIRNRENAVFKAQIPGQTVALRLHRLGYQSALHIEGELTWTTKLADQGFPCPNPVRSLSHKLVHTLTGGQCVSAIRWIDAEPIGAHGVPLNNAPIQFERIGHLLAMLHNLTDAQSQRYPRPSWSEDGLLGDEPLWGRFWENPALSEAERSLTLSARDAARGALASLNDPDIGLIHADLMQENILENSAGLHLIDFDDSGTGYRLYDLGTALVQHTEADAFPEIEAALWKGYAAHRNRDLPHPNILALFTLLRGMASAGWIISRANAEDPIHRIYANRMLNCIHRYNGQRMAIV